MVLSVGVFGKFYEVRAGEEIRGGWSRGDSDNLSKSRLVRHLKTLAARPHLEHLGPDSAVAEVDVNDLFSRIAVKEVSSLPIQIAVVATSLTTLPELRNDCRNAPPNRRCRDDSPTKAQASWQGFLREHR